MAKSRKTEFCYLDEARHIAGFFVSEVCQELGISQRTWYRWRSQGYGPKWALKCLEILSGDLSHLGWKNFYIKDSVLYNRELNTKYYNWETQDLMITVFCACPAHQSVRRTKTEGGAVEAATRGLRGASAPILSPPLLRGSTG